MKLGKVVKGNRRSLF